MEQPTEISNPATGERIVFDESATTPERLVWEEYRPAAVEPPPPHFHPDTEERFRVNEGCLVVEIEGSEHRVEAGEEIVVPPNTPHVSYTETESARFVRDVTPPGRWREALTDRFAAARATDGLSGVTGRLQVVLLAREYPDVVVPTRPPRPVQRVLVPVLAGVARAVGLRPHYPYPDDAATDRESNGRTVRRYPEAVASGDLDVLDDICTEDVVSHAPLGEPRGVEALKEYEAPIHEAFTDFEVTVEHLVEEGDHVAMHLTIRGTHRGEMMGVAPTGEEIEFQNMIFHRMEDGRIAERWVQPDVLGLLQQLGAIEDQPR
jgi:steroid delta-isomerase-like uncharacterized protein